ncbi:MAG: LamG-like jellyroll fold domain-containing protein [Lutibacter sp.]
MKKYLHSCLLTSKAIFFLFLMVGFLGNAQTMKVSILGGAQVTNGGALTITAGNSVTFQITNTALGNCSSVNVNDINISDTANFSITPSNPSENIKSASCNNGTKFLNFTITATGSACATTITRVTIEGNNFANFWFDLTVVKAPIISVLGGTPSADIINGTTTTTATNGTFFGIVEELASVTRYYVIINTGSCPLVISSIVDTHADFVLPPYVLLPNYTPTAITTPINPGTYVILPVTFTAGSTAGTQVSTITIANNDVTANPFTFNVSADVFNFNIPGPGGVTADFRLWLKATRGVTSSASKVSLWKDLGTNGKNAEQTDANLQPTYLNTATSNINFNPVIKFENGAATEQYLYNNTNGFYSQDIFIVMIPDNSLTNTSSRNTIFAGVSKKAIDDNTFDANDITGVGFGDYTTRFTNEVLAYGQNTEASSFNSVAEINTSYANAGIINIRNDVDVATKQELLYNSKLLSTSSVDDVSFTNVGYIDGSLYQGTPYWIGRNYGIQGSLNGRVAEIMTFAQRVPDADRPKIETYLAIKYGITLGATIAEKNYVNSAGTVIWNITTNVGFNYNIAGIGKDDSSDLNQKQSKSINNTNEVTIGLGVIAATNSANTNEFTNNKDFLVWGCDDGPFTGTSANTVTIASGITTSLTRIDRKWKIVETGIDVENIYISIPSNAFSGFAKLAEEEYVLIVSDDASFSNGNIIDVVPIKSDGNGGLQTWYDFDGTKFFTFGKAPKLTGARAVNIAAGDYLVGEYALNLNINAFTISAWVKCAPIASTRTIMAKGSKLQLRLNGSNNIEVMVDNDATPRFTSVMALNDGKWHNVSFVYVSGTVFLYIDGILDSSVQSVNPPTPNYNRFSIGAVYIAKNNIINPFLGEIDEVYVWDQGLTQNQVRYLMNQEIEKVTGNLVNGKSIPKAITNNEVGAINWATLKAYYDFNSFYGTTVEGLTDARNFLRIRYLDKTKTITALQTAPLPYVSLAGGFWGDATTWTNSTVQNLPNSIGLDGATAID